MNAVTITPLGSYRNDSPYPFCPGCGHKSILDHLNEALVAMQVDPARTVIVTDIGCSGLSDQYFITSAFHGLHGRSVTYATGIKLANPELNVVVIMGDGGTGIGGTHLLNAARRNIGVTVLVFNNLNYGMTGGQHSATTPLGAITATTPGGNLERPLDICSSVGVNGAGYVWRGTNFDDDLTDRMVEAMRADCFALLDIWELCTAYYVKANEFGRRAIDETLEELQFGTGILYRAERPEYAAAVRSASVPSADIEPRPIPQDWSADLTQPIMLEVAGSAGGRVRSAVRLVAEAAVRSGLYAAQRDDYPVTVKTGHSLARLTLAGRPIDYAGKDEPDYLLILSDDGYRKVRNRLATIPSNAVVFTTPDFPSLPAPDVRILDVGSLPDRVAKADFGLVMLSAVITATGLIPVEALEAAAAGGPFGKSNLAAVRLGQQLAGSRG